MERFLVLFISHKLSRVRCGTCFYRFLIFAFFLTVLLTRVSTRKKYRILCYPHRKNSGWLPIRSAFFIISPYLIDLFFLAITERESRIQHS